jgi:aryl-alcohol dehydrogenase-like predicted oxidoreductase
MTSPTGRIPGIEKPVSRLVLGSMIIHTDRLEDSMRLLDDAFSLGITTIDTAHIYGGGNSERAIGQWLAARGNREQVVIVSKGCHHNGDRKRITPFDLRTDLHDSLARLKTTYVDAYLLHRDDPSQPVGPIVEAFNELRSQGKLRAFGVSNWRHDRIQEANDYAAAHGLAGFTLSSPHYSLADQVGDPWGAGCVALSGPRETEAREWYQRTGMVVFPYSSMARGFFSGRLKSTDRNRFAETGVVDAACQRAYCFDVNFQRLERVEQLAAETGHTVPQIALAYVLCQPLNIHPLVGAANRGEIESCLSALELDLSPETLAWLDLRRDSR